MGVEGVISTGQVIASHQLLSEALSPTAFSFGFDDFESSSSVSDRYKDGCAFSKPQSHCGLPCPQAHGEETSLEGLLGTEASLYPLLFCTYESQELKADFILRLGANCLWFCFS